LAVNIWTLMTVSVKLCWQKMRRVISITAPVNGTTVGGTITVSANASDNVGVVGVQFKLDGVNYGAELTAAPYSASWDTTRAANEDRQSSCAVRLETAATQGA